MLEADEFKSIALSAVLILINVGLMMGLSYTPVSKLLGIAFSIPIAGIVLYGGMLTIGNYLSHRGVKRDDVGPAVIGVVLLQFAYSSFGAGLLAGLSASFQSVVLLMTAGVTTTIAVAAAGLVYGTGRDFSSWSRYSTYLFIGVLVFGAVGSIFPAVLLLAFLCALLGFTVYLIYEIWDMRTHPSKVYLNGIGIYVAFMGVFIQILQIILRLLSEE